MLFCAWTQVVCRQLGYNGIVIPLTNAVFGQGNGTIWMFNVTCAGTEQSLDQCPFSIRNCMHDGVAGVVCECKEMCVWCVCVWCVWCVYVCGVCVVCVCLCDVEVQYCMDVCSVNVREERWERVKSCNVHV